MRPLTRSLLWSGIVAAGVAACATAAAAPRVAPKPKPPTFSSAEFGGSRVELTVTHVIRWADDGNGAVDTLIVTETATGQPTQTLRIGLPVSPRSVVFGWPRPSAGQTISGVITAQLKRRGALGGIASRAWTFTQPDVMPPTPTIDTSLVILGVEVKPDSIRLATRAGTQFCAFVRFGNGKIVNRARSPFACAFVWTSSYPDQDRFHTLAQEARADSVCIEWRTETVVAPEPCASGTPSGLRFVTRIQTRALGVRLASRP